MEKLIEREATDKIIAAAIQVHKTIGPGFHENIYERALVRELSRRKIPFENQKIVNIYYKGEKVGYYKLDLLVDNKVLVELKTIDKL